MLLGLLWFVPVNADNHCPDKNPEIILDLGGTPEPEKLYTLHIALAQVHMIIVEQWDVP